MINGLAVLTDSKLSGIIGIKELLTLWGLSHACRVDTVVRQADGNRSPAISRVFYSLWSIFLIRMKGIVKSDVFGFSI